MPTLQELTLAHSHRLSEIYRTRDVRVAETEASRDLELRALPAAARAYQKYDDELAVAREKQLAAEAKAEAARTSTLITDVDRRADALADAQLARRSADVEAVKQKRRLEDAAETKYLAALSSLRHLPDAQRSKALQDADRARRLELDQAKQTHDEGLTSSQQRYRAAVDEAVTRRAARRSRRRTRLPRNLAVRRSGRLGGKDGGPPDTLGSLVRNRRGARDSAPLARAALGHHQRNRGSGERGILALPQ